MLAYADEWFAIYARTNNTDDWCRARKLERVGILWLAQANGSLGWSP